MNHSLKIYLGDNGDSVGIVRCKKVTIREKLLRYLLGEQRRVTIIVPGDSVKTLSIKEEPEEDTNDA